MTQTIAIEKLTMASLKQQTNIVRAKDDAFFPEWKTDLPALDQFEQARLERIKAIYRNLEESAVLESSVNMTIVSPLLDATGLFLPPFSLETEKTVEIVGVDEDTKLRGRLDVLIIKDTLWVLTIESKQAGFAPRVGIPQLLAYMLAAPKKQQSIYGLVTNGRNFVFLKLEKGSVPVYEQSQEFIIDRENDLEQTLRIIKKIASIR